MSCLTRLKQYMRTQKKQAIKGEVVATLVDKGLQKGKYEEERKKREPHTEE